MFKTKSLLGIALTFAFMLAMSVPCLASHPYHVSYAEVEWNPKTGNFEVSLCVWPADLEKAVSAQEKKSVDLDKADDLDALFEKFVSHHFSIQRAAKDQGETKPQNVRWVGHELNLKKAWLYFEVEGDRDPGNWEIENRVFLSMNDEQVNHIQYKCGEVFANLRTSNGSESLKISTKK